MLLNERPYCVKVPLIEFFPIDYINSIQFIDENCFSPSRIWEADIHTSFYLKNEKYIDQIAVIMFESIGGREHTSLLHGYNMDGDGIKYYMVFLYKTEKEMIINKLKFS